METPMTSRRRVHAALRHEEPDRVPIDFGGRHSVRFGSIHNIAAGVPPQNVVAMFRAAQKYGSSR